MSFHFAPLGDFLLNFFKLILVFELPLAAILCHLCFVSSSLLLLQFVCVHLMFIISILVRVLVSVLIIDQKNVVLAVSFHVVLILIWAARPILSVSLGLLTSNICIFSHVNHHQSLIFNFDLGHLVCCLNSIYSLLGLVLFIFRDTKVPTIS